MCKMFCKASCHCSLEADSITVIDDTLALNHLNLEVICNRGVNSQFLQVRIDPALDIINILTQLAPPAAHVGGGGGGPSGGRVRLGAAHEARRGRGVGGDAAHFCGRGGGPENLEVW